MGTVMLIEFRGDMYTLRELCGRYQVHPATARQRIKAGETTEAVFTIDRRGKPRPVRAFR